MKKSRWKRFVLLLLLVAAVLLVTVFFILPRVLPEKETVTEETMPAGAALELPAVPLTPATMTAAQKQAAIETARQDAIAAALASGQPDEEAHAAGEAMAEAARRAMYRPLSVTAGQP